MYMKQVSLAVQLKAARVLSFLPVILLEHEFVSHHNVKTTNLSRINPDRPHYFHRVYHTDRRSHCQTRNYLQTKLGREWH